MRCPNCQFENPEGHRFCGQCGHELEEQQRIAEPHPTLDAERKRVTALFSDISGYTAMTSKLDPEEVKEITSRVFDGVREVVGKYEGFIERFAGDGVLALFGVPKSHEDDPIRAVHAAREIHELVESLSPQYQGKIGRPLSMHSGVNTGLAITADVNPEKGTHGVTGDAINVAARLSDLAQAREILVGPDTHRVCRNHFSFQPLPPAKVKGKSEPIPIFRVLSAKVPVPQVRTGRQVSSEMVGREKELDKLELQVMKAINGEGSVVNVIGEAGIGKSRLIAELKKREVMKRVTLLEGRAISIGKNLSFHPIIDLLKQWAQIAEDDSETKAFEKLETAVRRVHPEETDEILPFVATLMGMKLTGKHAERVKGIEGEALEKLILKNVRELVIQGSELRPSVIIMEDLHWADTSSIELMGSLYRLAEKYRIAFINVFRPGYFDSDDGVLAKIGERLPVYYVEIQIQPLDKNDSETLINNMLEIKGLPYSLKTQIVERAGGNPFFIEEVVRSLIDEGAVVKRDGGFEVTDKIEKVVVPPTINDVLMSRIDRLEERTRELVKVASVIGRSFFDRIIKDVADSIGNVDHRLEYLKDVQLIRDRTHMQELEYLFKHALAQEAAYESTLIQQRKTLHLKVAQSIEKIFQERLHEFYGMLAYHYSKGEDTEKAEEYMTRAGEEALGSSASSEALNYFRQALKLYEDRCGESADTEKLAAFEKNIALAYFYKGQYANAVEYFDKVLVRWNKELPRNRIRRVLKSSLDVLTIFCHVYLTPNKTRRKPSDQDTDLFDIWFKNCLALAQTESDRFLSEYPAMLRKSTQFEPARLRTGAEMWLGFSAYFSMFRPSFRLIRKFQEYSENLVNPNSINDLSAHILVDTVNKVCPGRWNEIRGCDQNLMDSAIRSGQIFHIDSYLWFYVVFNLEVGGFQTADSSIEKLSNIADQYQHGCANVHLHELKADLFIKKRNLKSAQMEVDKGMSWVLQTRLETDQILLLGQKTIIQALEGDLDGARQSIIHARDVIGKQRNVYPLYLATHLLGVFLVDLALIRAAMKSNDGSSLQDLIRDANRSCKAALRNSRKYAPYRTWILLLMGHYYWLVGKQHKAMKWYDRSIKEGERLGARPDLSRTYFEVGKRLLEPHSKYKQLNGIDAKGYFEKAEKLFREMGLEHDLDELERVRLEM